MTVLITLTLAGSNVGPFNLYTDQNNYASAFETGISRDDLLAGYTSTLVPDGSTIIRAVSTITCGNHIDLPIIGNTTTTSTTSTTSSTTTLPPPPATSILTFQSYESGQFTFTLSNALSVPVAITYAGVNGSHVSNCGPYEESDDVSGLMLTIPAGSLSANTIGNSPLSCNVVSWRRENTIEIGGIVSPLTNGETVSIGGTMVTIVINGLCNNTYHC